MIIMILVVIVFIGQNNVSDLPNDSLDANFFTGCDVLNLGDFGKVIVAKREMIDKIFQSIDFQLFEFASVKTSNTGKFFDWCLRVHANFAILAELQTLSTKY